MTIPWDAVGAIGSWVEAFALLALFAWEFWDAKGQHEETRKQLKASQDAADAALLNARAVIATERPWIVVTPDFEDGLYLFEVVNRGRTLARIVSVAFEFTFASYCDKNRHPSPTYATKIPVSRDLLEQGGAFVIPLTKDPWMIIIEAKMEKRVRIGNQYLIFDGKITYRDVLDAEPVASAAHETVFSYYYDLQTKEMARMDDFSSYT